MNQPLGFTHHRLEDQRNGQGLWTSQQAIGRRWHEEQDDAPNLDACEYLENKIFPIDVAVTVSTEDEGI